MPVPADNPAKKRKIDIIPRQSSRFRQPSTRALQYLYEEADSESDEIDLLDSDAGLDDDENIEDDEELLDGQEDKGQEVDSLEGGDCTDGFGNESETAVDSGGDDAKERAPVVPYKRMRGPGKGEYLLLLLMVPPY